MIFRIPRPLRFDDRFDSGKYAGEMVCEVMAKDIGYLWFMQRNGISFAENVNRCLVGIKKDNKRWNNKLKIEKL